MGIVVIPAYRGDIAFVCVSLVVQFVRFVLILLCVTSVCK